MVCRRNSRKRCNSRKRFSSRMDEASEILAVGEGIGGGFTHTSELTPMKYDEVRAKDPIGWSKAVEKEHNRMKEHKVFKVVKKQMFRKVPRF